MVETAPSVTAGLFAELMAVDDPPENPFGLAVMNWPLITAVPVAANEITLVPAFIVEFAATVRVREAAIPILKFAVDNRLPVFTLPTEMFLVTFNEVIAALKVAPEALVLLTFKLPYAPALKKLMVWGLESA